MLALAHENSSEVLSEERGDDLWRIFEGYAKAGLGIIEGWLQDNPIDLRDKTFIAKITEKAKKLNGQNWLREQGGRKFLDRKTLKVSV